MTETIATCECGHDVTEHEFHSGQCQICDCQYFDRETPDADEEPQYRGERKA